MNKYSIAFILICLYCFTGTIFAQKSNFIESGIPMKDTNGELINAHGGGILYYNKTYYWYGEIKKGETWLVPNSNWENYRVNAGGVSCYSSKDLINWKFENIVLAAETNDSTHDLHTSKVIERPKVLYNKKTKKFVMWMHIDSQDYSYARSGVAISDTPTGSFKYLNSVRPNGNMARDMTLFQDEDGKAYHFYSSEHNATMYITLLSDDYLSHTQSEKRILINQSREAPAVFKYNGKYYLISSGCTGWSPNAASYAVADNIMDDWTMHDNPCLGPDAKNTYHAQSTFVLPLYGKKSNAFLFMADKWNKKDLKNSHYVWLPLIMNTLGIPEIQWHEKWNFKNLK